MGHPALLFTGSHGVHFRDRNSTRLPAIIGAIVTQEWEKDGSSPEPWFAGSDLGPEARVFGMIHFLFNCYGVGCPQFDNFSRLDKTVTQIAPASLVSRLPQRLLAHPRGGALAVIGHIDRAWVYSFESSSGVPQDGDIRMVLNKILNGERVGNAMDKFNGTWASLSTGIADLLDQVQRSHRILSVDESADLDLKWVARDDARNYVILGDPAVRLLTEDLLEPQVG